ncbi:MAG: phage tail protein [Rhodanobacter sp.]|nr:phage tail protein [Rhodanobacter sp.]OJV51418.1 MAG: oxidoreductase [Burkholderiales bacterium 68-10]
MLMSLGQFVFQLQDLAYSELARATAWRHASNSRVGARPALQFVGPGEDTITLSGVLVPEVAGTLQSLATLRDMADAGDAYAMVDGAGRIFGAWVIERIEEGGSAFTADGIARRTAFTVSLKRADDGRVSSAPPGNGPTA